MYPKLSVSLFLCLGLSVALAAKLKLHVTLKSNAKIQALQEESEALAVTHRESSEACFGYYRPRLYQISNQYEVAYGVCVKNHDNASANIEAKYAKDRLEMAESANDSCRALSQCNAGTNSTAFFECVAARGAEDSKIFYTMSAQSAQLAANIEEEYRIIDTQNIICINNAERSYVENTADTYEELNACLRGEVDFTWDDDKTTEDDATTEYTTLY